MLVMLTFPYEEVFAEISLVPRIYGCMQCQHVWLLAEVLPLGIRQSISSVIFKYWIPLVCGLMSEL